MRWPQTSPEPQQFGSRCSGFPEGSLLVSIGDGAYPPLQLEGALIPPLGPEPQAVPGASCCAITGMEPPAPRANPLPPARAEALKRVWS